MVKKKNNNYLFYYFLLFIIISLLILLIFYYYYINNNKINFENDNLYEIKHKYYKLESQLNNKDNELNNIITKYNKLENNLNNKDNELNDIKNKYNKLEHNLDDIKINKDNELNDIKAKYNLLENDSSNFKNDDKVCMNIDKFNKLNDQNFNNNNTTERDYRVINDPLFPPFNRSDRNTHTNLRNNINKRNMYVNTNNIDDTFRLVAYITCTDENKDVGNNSWKLFGREKDRHFSEFYMTPTDNTNDIKIFLNDNIINGNKVRDIYNIPQYINFNSHMLNSSPYYVNEIPKQNLSYQNFYM